MSLKIYTNKVCDLLQNWNKDFTPNLIINKLNCGPDIIWAFTQDLSVFSGASFIRASIVVS